MDFDLQEVEPVPGGIPVISNHFIMSYKQLQMELQQIYSDCHLDSQHFYSVGEQTVKP